MRILVVGAARSAAISARPLQAGRDVTFLVRPKRAAQLAATGADRQKPMATSIYRTRRCRGAGPGQPFDLIILTCKAYDLDGAIKFFAPPSAPTR